MRFIAQRCTPAILLMAQRCTPAILFRADSTSGGNAAGVGGVTNVERPVCGSGSNRWSPHRISNWLHIFGFLILQNLLPGVSCIRCFVATTCVGGAHGKVVMASNSKSGEINQGKFRILPQGPLKHAHELKTKHSGNAL